MKTPAGLVNQKIEIYSDQDVRNNSAGVDPNSALYWATTARVERLGAPRNLGQMLEQFTPTFRFTVNDRIDKNVQANMLIKYRGEWFTILSAEPDFVYRDSLVMTAVTGKLPQRSVPSGAIVFYGYLDSRVILPYNDIIQGSPIEITSGDEVLVPYSTDIPRHLWLALPHGEPVKTGFVDIVNIRNEGPIGGAEDFIKGPYLVDGPTDYDFYISNKTTYYHPPEIPSGILYKTL